MSILFHFTLILLKLKYVLITADLLNQNPTKNVILLYKKLFINSTKFTLILIVFDSNVYSKSNMSRNVSDNIAV